MKLIIKRTCFGDILEFEKSSGKTEKFQELSPELKQNLLKMMIEKLLSLNSADNIVKVLVDNFGAYESFNDSCEQCGHYYFETKFEM